MEIVRISVSPVSPPGPSPSDYSKMSDSDLARAFGDNFQAFKHPTTPNATTDKIREVAGRSLTGDAQKDNETRLAREVLKRDNVLDELDSVDDNGKRDGVIGPWNPNMAADKLACNRCMQPPITTLQITY
ncbi:hypothetical protein C4J95_3252 [Pseudomonas orientalis]|uniref:hypothetical protein n=1 Tax=Pseudomonas orientalis TaxID=76758 RepID=UPI000F55BCF4|nr:hypothetical protein [Pseudomonas orientalis]AZF00712.1 hypothetical protein C4J95_3252 [Pseudomonas orientalis]